MYHYCTIIMAKFNDSQVLKLLIERINELYAVLPSEPTGFRALDLFDFGRRSVLDSLYQALSFYQDYEFD